MDKPESKQKRPHIAAGYQIGKLTVIDKQKERRHGYVVWRCRCECGREISLDTRYLQRGAVKDCGFCGKKAGMLADLTGKRFGHLVCAGKVEETTDGKKGLWNCICDCGSSCEVPANKLLTGMKKSCGCLRKPMLKDYIGKVFGDLQVVEYVGKKNGMHRWKCICICGKETMVGQTLLQSGKTTSCGCKKLKVFKENLKLCEGTSVAKLEHNDKLFKNNTSGCTGVYQNKKTGKWVAQITFKGKTHYLGSYEDIEDAVKARKNAESMHKDFVDWYYKEK